MTGSVCEGIKDLLPDLVAGKLPQDGASTIEDHLSACADCRAELEILRGLRATLVRELSVPPELEATIRARVRAEFEEALTEGRGARVTGLRAEDRRRRVPTWALSAAAVVVLALGTGIIWSRSGTDGVLDPLAVASQEPLPEAWLWDDGLIAGAPVFDGLSDEDLEALLKEFEG